MRNQYLSLQPSEGIVIRAAADIYAAYIVANRVSEGEEDKWMQRSVREALSIARTADESISSDREVGPIG